GGAGAPPHANRMGFSRSQGGLAGARAGGAGFCGSPIFLRLPISLATALFDVGLCAFGPLWIVAGCRAGDLAGVCRRSAERPQGNGRRRVYRWSRVRLLPGFAGAAARPQPSPVLAHGVLCSVVAPGWREGLATTGCTSYRRI